MQDNQLSRADWPEIIDFVLKQRRATILSLHKNCVTLGQHPEARLGRNIVLPCLT